MLEIGEKAPDFEVVDAQGELVKLSDYRGRKLLMWFFPKASTPGCTTEGCGLRDDYAQFQSKGVEILGVSKDSPKKQLKFVEKYDFPYRMLCDEEGSVVEAYGAWGLKKFMGREFMGILRISYLINEEGVVEHLWAKVKTKTHSQDVLSAL